MVNQARLKSLARSHRPDGWGRSNKREMRMESRNPVLFFVLFIMDLEHKLFLLTSQQPFIFFCAFCCFVVIFFCMRKNIPSSSCLCRWFLNSDCSYDSAMPRERKPPSHPSAFVMDLHLMQGTAMEYCSAVPWCMKILQEGHPGNLVAAAVEILSA